MSSYLIANNKFSGIIINGKLIQFFIKACHKILVLVLIPLLGLYFLMELSRPKKKKLLVTLHSSVYTHFIHEKNNEGSNWSIFLKCRLLFDTK